MVKTIDLDQIKRETLNKMHVRREVSEFIQKQIESGVLSEKEKFQDGKVRAQVLVCGGTGCHSSGSLKVMNELNKQIAAKGIREEVEVIQTGCFGLCALGPIMIIHPDAAFYSNVEIENIEDIVERHLKNGEIAKEYLYAETVLEDSIKPLGEVNFYKKQMRIVLRNAGVIDPEKIEEYIAMDGYQALRKVLTSMEPQDVIDEIKASKLRGRGGAGFQTGLKWQFTADAIGDTKYVCCNADEGDPGAFMDRSVLEGDPHTIIEAMAIAAYAVGANQGYVYIRAEYPIAVERLKIAIREAKELGVLGDNIFGTEFSFDLGIRLGAGAFVCGEETALISSIEGNRGEPRPRPPFPAVKGLWQKPTLLNNVETYANITAIILNGADWFKSIGTENSTGTKVFAVGGKINNTGLVEVPMGTTLREIIYDIGGGIPEGKAFKAAQTGGPSGGCIPAHLIDTPIDFDSLKEIGSMMGSGGLIVMDEDSCMVDIAKFYLDFTVDESCGKCVPCRIGTKRMQEVLTKFTEGKGTAEDLENLEVLANSITQSSFCALGQTAPNPVLSTLEFFRDEYEAHIFEKRCPASSCKSLLKYVIIADKCRGCTLCARKCPVDAISGEVKHPFVIDTDKCIKCGVCIDSCKFGAVVRV